MDPTKETILELVPAIRMIMSEDLLKSGSFVPIDQLIETDPGKITVRLGRDIPVFGGEPETVLKQISSSKEDMGEYIFIDGAGLLGISSDQSKVEQNLATVRKESRKTDLSEPVAPAQVNNTLYNRNSIFPVNGCVEFLIRVYYIQEMMGDTLFFFR